MARNRLIKKEFFRDEKVGSLPLGARLLFISLWIQADDSGNAVADPRLMKAEAFPYDAEISAQNVEEWIAHLEKFGMVKRYEASGQRYLNVCNFKKHQVINRPSKLKHPKMSTPRALSESSSSATGNAHGALTHQSKSKGEGEGKRKGERRTVKKNGNVKAVTVGDVTVPDRSTGPDSSVRPCARKAENAWAFSGLDRKRIAKEFLAVGAFGSFLETHFEKYKSESHATENGAELCYCYPSDFLNEVMDECDGKAEYPKACLAQKKRLEELEASWVE
jgi:hypothetical protein